MKPALGIRESIKRKYLEMSRSGRFFTLNSSCLGPPKKSSWTCRNPGCPICRSKSPAFFSGWTDFWGFGSNRSIKLWQSSSWVCRSLESHVLFKIGGKRPQPKLKRYLENEYPRPNLKGWRKFVALKGPLRFEWFLAKKKKKDSETKVQIYARVTPSPAALSFLDCIKNAHM